MKTIHDKIGACQEALDAAKIEKAQLDALALLLSTGEVQDAPNRIDFMMPAKILTVGIGKDHTATLYLWSDDIEELSKILGETDNVS